MDTKIHTGSQRGPDVEIILKKSPKRINIEIQRFNSGTSWKSKTIPSWKARLKFLTFVVFPESTIEHVISKIEEIPEYDFFKEEGVFLIPESQISEMVSIIGLLAILDS